MAKKKTDEIAAPDTSPMIQVVANGYLYENGVQIPKGTTFETTTDRAAGLGDLVSVVDTPAE